MTLAFCICTNYVHGQYGVRFMTGSLTGVQSVAKEKGKNLLIDTYASWCIPCKRMDKVFARRDVGEFYNENYITYKVNMDGPYGDAVRAQYAVVFLPTIIIVGPDGTIKYKVDREMSADELLSVGKLALQDGIQIASDATAIRRNGELNPEVNYSNTSVVSKPKKPVKSAPAKGKAQKSADNNIVYVLGLDGGENDPTFLRKEAYFRLELMDGSHKSAAKNYLATQSDWSTVENMRFILDFVEQPWSDNYNHIISQKESYYNTFGKDQVDNALQILVYKHLYKGFPRPTFNQATQLFKDLGYPQASHEAQKYFITRNKVEHNHQQVFDLSYKYLTEMNPADKKVMWTLLEYLNDNSLQFSASQLTKATELGLSSVLSIDEQLQFRPYIIKLLIKADKCSAAKKLFINTQKQVEESSTNLPQLNTIVFNCDA